MGYRLNALTIHANGYVTLQDNPFGTGIIGCGQQLDMQLILDIIDQIGLILLCQPLGIGYQPQFVLLIPDLEFFRIKRLSATLFKDVTDICRLDTIHQFIVAIG